MPTGPAVPACRPARLRWSQRHRGAAPRHWMGQRVPAPALTLRYPASSSLAPRWGWCSRYARPSCLLWMVRTPASRGACPQPSLGSSSRAPRKPEPLCDVPREPCLGLSPLCLSALVCAPSSVPALPVTGVLGLPFLSLGVAFSLLGIELCCPGPTSPRALSQLGSSPCRLGSPNPPLLFTSGSAASCL